MTRNTAPSDVRARIVMYVSDLLDVEPKMPYEFLDHLQMKRFGFKIGRGDINEMKRARGVVRPYKPRTKKEEPTPEFMYSVVKHPVDQAITVEGGDVVA